MSAKKLYPPKCAKCGQFISNKDFENDRVRTKQNYYNFGGLDIWFEHQYDCKKMLGDFDKSKSRVNQDKQLTEKQNHN